MNTINVNLTGRQVLRICEGLIAEANRFDKLRETRRDVTAHTKKVWHDCSIDRRNISRQLMRASQDDQLNPHVPVTIDD